MLTISIDKIKYDIHSLKLDGPDDAELKKLLGRADRVENPWLYAWAAAEAAGEDIPPEGEKRNRLLHSYLPDEFRMTAEQSFELTCEITRKALERAGADLNGKVPGDIADYRKICSALWGRTENTGQGNV